jgi:hypothetical protein
MSRHALLIAFPLLLVACGGSKHASTPTTTTSSATTTTAVVTTSPHTTTSATPGPGALQGEALSAAAGDIPDNQMFVSYSGPAFSMKVPEGWARRSSSAGTIFRDKNNIVRVVVARGAVPTIASMTKELAGDTKAHVVKPPHAVKVGRTSMIAATYTSTSAPNQVTGKSVILTVDRYELAKGGKRAVVDLGTPVGVDNVDAYRMMIESLRVR